MAWRLHEPVTRGELDFTRRGAVTGRLWFVGRDAPVTLDLTGTPWRDLAGHRLTFINPNPRGKTPGEGFAALQEGVTGDITASRKLKIPSCTDEELTAHLRNRTPFPWHWGNTLYLEWFSHANGRVVIESAELELTLEAVGAWTLDETEEAAQQAANREALTAFLETLAGSAPPDFDDYLPEEEEAPSSEAEAEADAEAARMDLLMDRVNARLLNEDRNDCKTFERVLKEERERLRRERGEPEPEPLTPEQEEEHARWIDEMNAVAEEALREMENDPDALVEDEDHPLQEECFELAIRLHREAEDAGWLSGATSHEHSLLELVTSVQIASAKLAGALGGATHRDEWPPDPLFAGDTLVRLKKARRELRNARTAARSALDDALAPREWLLAADQAVAAILTGTETLIAEVRDSLE